MMPYQHFSLRDILVEMIKNSIREALERRFARLHLGL